VEPTYYYNRNKRNKVYPAKLPSSNIYQFNLLAII